MASATSGPLFWNNFCDFFLEKNDFVLPGTDLTFSGVWWILVGRVVIGENGNYKATDALSGLGVSRTQSTVTMVRIG